MSGPLGRLIPFNGVPRHVQLQGAGAPVVVFESGMGGGVAEWEAVASALVAEATVFRHERPGLGWSEPVKAGRAEDGPLDERFALGAAKDLHALLHHLKLPGPYVLVGHSLGALHVRAFAGLFPREVAGLVLVDPSHEDQFQCLPRVATLTRWQLRLSRWLVDAGPVGRAALRTLLRKGYAAECAQPLSALARDVLHRVSQDWRRPGVLRTMTHELAGLEPCFDQVRALNARTRFPAVPMRVISQGRSRRSGPMVALLPQWQALHAGLCSLSPYGTHLIATQSGHLVPLDEPELIVTAIRSVMP